MLEALALLFTFIAGFCFSWVFFWWHLSEARKVCESQSEIISRQIEVINYSITSQQKVMPRPGTFALRRMDDETEAAIEQQ